MAFIPNLLRAFTCVLVWAALAPSVAVADPAQGQAAFAEGQRLFLAGDYRGALTRFKTGYEQTQDPAFLLNIAQCHRSLGESGDASMMFRLYLKSSPQGLNPDARAAAAKAIKELEAETKATPPTKAAAAVPSAVPAPSAPSLPPDSATDPALTSSRSARRFQNNPGGMPVLEPLPELEAPKTWEPSPAAVQSTESTRRSLRIAGIVCGGVGLLAVGAGVYYWTRARSLSDSANQSTIYNQTDYDQGKSAEKMQWIFYGAGGAAVVTGVGFWVYSSLLAPPQVAKVSLAPLVAPGTAGVAAGGSF